jgi:hypothetical protein
VHATAPVTPVTAESSAHGVGVPTQPVSPFRPHAQPVWLLHAVAPGSEEHGVIVPLHVDAFHVQPYASSQAVSVTLPAHGIVVPTHPASASMEQPGQTGSVVDPHRSVGQLAHVE